MSYSAIIQKDSPAITWSLDESTVTDNSAVNPDRFLYTNGAGTTFNTGVYNNVVRVNVPIVYGEKQSIKVNNDISNNKYGYIKVPSLNKMSAKDVGNRSSLEFWVKLDTSHSTEQVIVSKKDVNASPAVDYATCIFLKNDYFVFRLGTSDRYFETAVQIDSINKPFHIVASYSPNEISLTVNGMSSSKSISDPESLFPVYDSEDEFFWFEKPANIENIQFDCISLYSFVLPRERSLRHFVYGCGYNVPASFINNNGGVAYNFSMDTHGPTRKYDYGAQNPWSLSSYNNAALVNGTMTIKKQEEPFIGQVSGLKQKDKDSLFTSTGFSFNSSSYLEIKNADAIIPQNDGGWVFRFNGSGVTVGSTKQTLFLIGSKDSLQYIECYLINSDIIFDINGTLTTATAPTITGDFYVGYYVKTSGQFIFYGTTGDIAYSAPTLSDVAISGYSIRVGSDDTWFDDSNEAATQNQFLGKLEEIKAINSSYVTEDTTVANLIALSNLYTASPSYEQKRFIIASSASAIIDIPKQSLCPIDSTTTGFSRIEVGNPKGSSSAITSFSVKTYANGTVTGTSLSDTVISDRIITSGSWLNNSSVQAENSSTNPVDIISINVTLATDDLINRPAMLNYLRLFTYQLETDDSGITNYTLCNASPGGNPAKIYFDSTSSTLNIPDLTETPLLYNGFNSGLNLYKTHATINHDIQSLEGSGIKAVSFMLYFPSGQSAGTYKVFDTSNSNTGFSIGSTGTVTKGSNVTSYINGSSSSGLVLLDQWQQITLIFETELSLPLITLGSSGQSVIMNVDQLMLFSNPYVVSSSYASFVQTLYNLTVGGIAATATDNAIIQLNDQQTEVGSGNNYKVYTYYANNIKEASTLMSDTNNTILSSIAGASTITIPINYIQQDTNENSIQKLTYTTGTGTSIQVPTSSYLTSNGTILLGTSEDGVFNALVNSISINEALALTTLYLNKSVTTTANTFLYFTNYAKNQNDAMYNKIFVNNRALIPGDKILIYAPVANKHYVYSVTSMTNYSRQIVNSTGNIVLTKVALNNGDVYSVPSDNNGLRHFQYNGTSFSEISLREKIKWKNYTQSANTVFTTEE
jgi:hypothetical protein